MKTSLKTTALSGYSPARISLPVPPSTFGAGFRRFLASAPQYDDALPVEAPYQQPVQYLASVEPESADTRCPLANANVQEALSRSLGSAILLAARPTTKSGPLAAAVIALRGY